MKRIFISAIIALAFISCEPQEQMYINADVVSFDIEEPDHYIMSDLRYQSTGWFEEANTPESEYYFETANDSLYFTINRPYHMARDLSSEEYIFGGKKQVVVKIGAERHFSFRIFNNTSEDF